MTRRGIVRTMVFTAALSVAASSVAEADDLRFQGVWFGPTFSMPLVPPRRSEWGGEIAFFYGTPASRISVGFDLGASTERAYADAFLFEMLFERAGWLVNAGPVLGYGAVDGVGGRLGIAGWAAPFFLPLILSVNVIAVPNAPILVLGTFSVRIGGGF